MVVVHDRARRRARWRVGVVARHDARVVGAARLWLAAAAAVSARSRRRRGGRRAPGPVARRRGRAPSCGAAPSARAGRRAHRPRPGRAGPVRDPAQRGRVGPVHGARRRGRRRARAHAARVPRRPACSSWSRSPTYVEGSSLHPERGGASTFARYAFDELWSFIAGWAILLDYLIVMAIGAVAISRLPRRLLDRSRRGRARDRDRRRSRSSTSPSRTCAASAPTGSAWCCACRCSASCCCWRSSVIALAQNWDPAAITDSVDLGATPSGTSSCSRRWWRASR